MKKFTLVSKAMVICFATIACFTASGCASIFGKSSRIFTIDARPENAKISITDKFGKEVYLGTAPATVVLKSGSGFFSKAEYQVKFSIEGFEDRIIPITYRIEGWYWANLFLGGIPGMLIIDPATGAMFKPVNTVLNETLVPKTRTSAALKIWDLNSVPKNIKENMVQIK